MKKVFLFLAVFTSLQFAWAQETDVNKVFQSAIESYEANELQKSADYFLKLIELINGMENLSDYALFRGACIFAGNNNNEKSFQILNYLVEKRYYSDLDEASGQVEFEKWYNLPEWDTIILKISKNKETYPVRNKENIKTKLLEAKAILEKDNGKHWGYPIWNDSIIVIDYDNTIYSLTELSDSKTEDNILFYKKIEPNPLAFVNTTQKYEEKEYATVLNNYLNDRSSTIIHELFHLLQFKFRKFNGNPINYLDETNARILMRLEYQALRNSLKAISENRDVEEVKNHLKNAVTFRKVRQKQYAEYLNDELEIETMEGTANYTGFALSTYENKYEKAISEINQREDAETYTRPFPYATGPAYGLIFDYLNIQWRDGLDKIYNFADIYETEVLKSILETNEQIIEQAKAKNNYEQIYEQEKAREENQNKLIEYYTDLLINKPILKVAVVDFDNFGLTFNMNGTLSIKNEGIIYSSIKGEDVSGGKNFGNFSTIDGTDELGKAGILSYEKEGINYFVFTLPIEIRDTKIIGEFYKIELNSQWKIVKHNDGNMEIVKK